MKNILRLLSGMLLVQSFIFSSQQTPEQQNESQLVTQREITQEEKDFLKGFNRGFERGIKERLEEQKQMEDPENRKQILQDFLQKISHIGDREYQKRVWIDGQGSGNNDFEAHMNYFFYKGWSVLKNHKELKFTDGQYSLLSDLRGQLVLFRNKKGPIQEILNCPEWQKVVAIAEEVLQTFDQDQRELAKLTNNN